MQLSALKNITLLSSDVTKPEQIKSTVEKAIALGDIDVVFNNAGYGLAGPLEGTTDAQLVRQIDTNLLDVIRVTQAFIPHFRAKKSGLFITTTSIGGLIALLPGGIHTDFINRSLDMGQHEAYDALVGQVLEVFIDPARTANFSTAEQIAEVVYEAATDGKDQLRYLAGEDAKDYYVQRQQVGDEAFRKGVGQAFFGE